MKPRLTKPAAIERLAKLRTLIERYRYEVHVLDKSSISEAALDSLKHELAEIEGWYPELITPDSPSQRVAGQPLPQFTKVTHTVRMFSLADVFSPEELGEWDERWKKKAGSARSKYLADLKLDGLAITLRYEAGLLTQAATRGDGFIGEDVTQNVRTIESVPLSLRLDDLPPTVQKIVRTGRVEVRGEVVMLKKDFAALNRRQAKLGLPLFANPRNVSAGSIRQLDSSITASRVLTFYAWELVSDLGQDSLAAAYDYLRDMGIKTNPRAAVCSTLDEVRQFHERIATEREGLPFWIDGVVVKLNDVALGRRLGFVGKTPRAAVAWKYSAEQVTTVVEDIVVQVGRTGAMTPVAHLRPVTVAGTTVSRATLHNADEITRLDVRVGDTVIIQKAGDIIPEVVQVLTDLRPADTKPWRMLKKCPVCRAPIERQEGEAIHYCRNKTCPAKQRERLYHFVSKPAFNLVGLGPSTVDVLVEEGLVHQPADFYALRPEQLVGLPLFAEKKAENIVAAIQARHHVTLDRFLYALGIRHVGAETARSLAAAFPKLETIMNADVERLATVSDIGQVVAQSIHSFFADQQQRQLAEHLRRLVTITAPRRASTDGPLAGKALVVTGTLDTYSRSEAEAAIRSAGGHPTSSVSANTLAVIAGSEPGSKVERARALGVPIWDEAEFRRQIGQS